jgi:hypothetical protein
MIFSFVSGHGQRGLLATGEAPQEAGCIACDRNDREGVWRQPYLQPESRRGASVGKIKGRRWTLDAEEELIFKGLQRVLPHQLSRCHAASGRSVPRPKRRLTASSAVISAADFTGSRFQLE